MEHFSCLLNVEDQLIGFDIIVVSYDNLSNDKRMKYMSLNYIKELNTKVKYV